MSKEKLHEIITESFVNDRIDVDKFLRLSNNLEKISENKAEEILTEIDWGKVAIIGGVSLLALLAMWAEIQDRKKRYDTEWKKCRDKCVNYFAPKIEKIRKIGKTVYGVSDDIGDLQDDFLECKSKCDDIYYKKVDEIKKKKKEIKNKIEKAKKEIKRRKEIKAKSKK